MVNPFGKLGDIGNLMKQAKGMQEKMQQAQKDLAALEIIGEAGAGMVKLKITGSGEALSLNIDESVFNEDKKILQGLVIAAINDANRKREEKKKETMSGFISGLGLPEDFELPGGDS